MLRLKKYYLSLIFFPLIHLSLVELFASTHYLVYFITLLFTLYFIYIKRLFLSNKMLLLSIVNLSGLYLIYRFFEDSFYDFYIDMDMKFELSYISYEICCILTAIHIFILFLLGYNRAKLT